MSAGRAVLRASKKLGSPPGKPSDYCPILNHLYDSECSGNDDYEKKSLRRKNIGVLDDEESLSLKVLSDLEENNVEVSSNDDGDSSWVYDSSDDSDRSMYLNCYKK